MRVPAALVQMDSVEQRAAAKSLFGTEKELNALQVLQLLRRVELGRLEWIDTCEGLLVDGKFTLDATKLAMLNKLTLEPRCTHARKLFISLVLAWSRLVRS